MFGRLYTGPRSQDGFGMSALTFVGEDDLLAIRVSHWKSTINHWRLRSLHLLHPRSGKARAGANDGVIHLASDGGNRQTGRLMIDVCNRRLAAVEMQKRADWQDRDGVLGCS